ncbi:endonuclease/exonuclease/phosphatase family protein [Anaerolineales bacterium HSG6]|nr:endonuclease/exonuclease/phosphatase family protein [Anaerolineales bacterium HSG6]MDM8531186.1 endonuclease/exonuclease/phosphatase family protein [Anaerolineales bacterium HSG25]
MYSAIATQNDRDPNTPRFESHYASSPTDFNGLTTVMTWNIKLSIPTEMIITELNRLTTSQGSVDIVLLQDIDEIRVDQIAKQLAYNYIYFPISRHGRHDENLGNAIITKWPLVKSKRLLLPYKNPLNDEMRGATKAMISVGGDDILVYSVHMDTSFLSRAQQATQIQTLLQDINPNCEQVIVGGDFNSLTSSDVINLDKLFRQVGLDRISAEAGHTHKFWDVNFTFDHIYAKGVSVVEAGVSEGTPIIDHFPLWAKTLPVHRFVDE